MYIETLSDGPRPSRLRRVAPEVREAAPERRALPLRWLLMLLDFAASLAGWGIATQLAKEGDSGSSTGDTLLMVMGLAGAFVALASAAQLYRARVCSLRSVEIHRLAKVVMAVGGLAVFLGSRLGITGALPIAALGCMATLSIAAGLRGAFRGWLQAQRKAGRFLRRVVLVGSNADAGRVLRLVDGHPEDGYKIVGVIGADPEEAAQLHCPYLGRLDDTVAAVRRAGANGVIIAATAWTSEELNRLLRELVAEELHVHLSTGVQGIAQSRLRPLPLAYEPLFYVESTKPAVWRLGLKRLLDVLAAGILLTLCLPILGLATLAVKLQDGGPVLFRQRRVGAGGRHFTMLKLRTMSPDAESRYADLAATHSGRSGPLVKLARDPRITRVGRLLRASSIDELPQLLNVLGGSMSMVGPRPNLLLEAEGLDPHFLAQKATVRPGITGLWQVEARDNPSFEEYVRYDIFYLENWTVGLDAAIMLATVTRVMGRTLRLCLRTQARGAVANSAIE